MAEVVENPISEMIDDSETIVEPEIVQDDSSDSVKDEPLEDVSKQESILAVDDVSTIDPGNENNPGVSSSDKLSDVGESNEQIDPPPQIDNDEEPQEAEVNEHKVESLIVDAGEHGEALQLFSTGNNMRDSVTNEFINLEELKLDAPDHGPSPSPPLEKREEIWTQFPNLQPAEEKETSPPPPPEKGEPTESKTDPDLIALKEILKSNPLDLKHCDEFLTCVLRSNDGDVPKASEVVLGLHQQMTQISANEKAQETTKDNKSKDLWAKFTSKEPQDNDKQVTIDSNEIGITVENVLERTVVHLVKEGSAAHVLGVTAGALLLAVHNSPTYNLSHFETVDALKRAPRPAKLRFRPLPPDLLVAMREQMQSLVVQTSAHTAIEQCVGRSLVSKESIPDVEVPSPLRFSVPPQPPHPQGDSPDSGHRPAPPSPVVVEWASEQVKLICLLYAGALSNSDPDGSDDATKSQQILITDILTNLNENFRRPTRPKINAINTHRLASLTHLVNSLVFGIPSRSSSTGEKKKDGSHTHRQIDWCSQLMSPFLYTLVDVACALLEADCDVPLVYQMAPQSCSSPLFFDASLEPVLNDGAAGALLIIAFRAIFHHKHQDAVQLSTSIAASLASTKCERGRVASCRLVLELYYHTDNEHQSEGLILRGIATRLLVQSQEATIRSAAVTSIQRLGKLATLNDLDWLILLCETAASDDDTMVRRGGFEFSLRILHRLPDIFPSTVISFEGTRDADIDLHLLRCKIVATVQRLVEDTVASVRHAVAAHCASLCTLLGGGRLGGQWSTWIVDTLHTFLRDDDSAVRSAAIDAIPFVTLLLRGFAHYYVYHANMLPSENVDAQSKQEGENEESAVLANRVISWNDVASLIKDCFAKSGTTEVVVSMSVTSMKRTASMLLPALLKLSQEAPEDVRCKVAGAVGQFFVHIQEEVLLLDLGGCGDENKPCEEFKRRAWYTLSQDLVCGLIAPLVKAVMKDQHLQVVATLFTELAALPQSFSCLDSEGGLVMSRRGIQPMSSIYLLTEELVSDSRSVLELHDAGVHKARHWATAEIVPESLLISFVGELETMIKHRDWRNRAVAVRGVLSFASFATSSSMQSKLAQICIRSMDDKVHAVRLAGAESICLTGLIHQPPSHTSSASSDDAPTEVLPDWREAVVIPQLYDLTQRPVARERQLALYMIQILVSLGIVTRDVTIGVLVPLLLNAAQDVVSNVRLSVAKTLYFFMRGSSEISDSGEGSDDEVSAPFPHDLVGVLAKHSELHRCVDRLCEDEDLDVNFHARQAKSALESLPSSS